MVELTVRLLNTIIWQLFFKLGSAKCVTSEKGRRIILITVRRYGTKKYAVDARHKMLWLIVHEPYTGCVGCVFCLCSEIHETQLGSFLFSWWQTVLKKSCQSGSKVYTVYPRNSKRSQLMSGLFIICFYFICPLEAPVFNCSVITHPLRILSTSAPEMDTYALLQ